MKAIPLPRLAAAASAFVSAVVLLTACHHAGAAVAATSGSDQALLGDLRVVSTLGPSTGYQRGCGAGQACSFGPAWTDNSTAPGSHNGCDTRNDVFAAQLTQVTYTAGSHCVVSTGTLLDPYTGTTLHFTRQRAQAVQIDHVVPLALAWRLGANQWTQAQRTTYANDKSLVLLAVSGTENERKSDSGPSGYMPPDHADWCRYATKFVTVLHVYNLAVLAADKTVLTHALATCPGN